MGTTASNLFRGGTAPAPKRLRRASELPAIQSVEDLFPPEVFFKTVAGGYLEAEEIGNIACANRQFKETSYNPRMTTGRGCVALIGQGCSPSVPEATKWFKIAAELHGTREALLFLGEWASGGTTTFMKFFVRSRSADPVDPVEAETLFRAAVAADDSPSESYCIFAPAGHAHDLARIGLATMLMKKGGDDALVEAASLLDAVLDHDNIPATQQQMRRPNSEARALRAEIILQQQAPGALAEALELVEAIPAADLEGIEGSNCAYVLGKIYKALDEETPNDEHARRAWEHINAAMGVGHPRAAFDVGQMAERGRGTPVHLLTAYTGYCMAVSRPVPDERAVARLREVAAGPQMPVELMVAIVRVRQYNAQADEVVQGNATFEQAMEHMNDPNQTLALLGIPAVDPAPQ